MVIQMPIEQYIVDKKEVESFKQLQVLTIDKRITSYTCFAKAFMIFVSEKEVACSKSAVLKSFTMVNSVKQFLDMGLPIRKYTTPEKQEGDCDLTEIYKNPKDRTIAFEIDCEQIKRVQRALNLTKLDCYPIVWCWQESQFSSKWNIRFEQRIACKYLVIRLIDRHQQHSYDANFDMFPLALEGY